MARNLLDGEGSCSTGAGPRRYCSSCTTPAGGISIFLVHRGVSVVLVVTRISHLPGGRPRKVNVPGSSRKASYGRVPGFAPAWTAWTLNPASGHPVPPVPFATMRPETRVSARRSSFTRSSPGRRTTVPAGTTQPLNVPTVWTRTRYSPGSSQALRNSPRASVRALKLTRWPGFAATRVSRTVAEPRRLPFPVKTRPVRLHSPPKTTSAVSST